MWWLGGLALSTAKMGFYAPGVGGRKQKRGERKASVADLELAARPGPGGDDDLHDLAGRRLDLSPRFCYMSAKEKPYQNWTICR